MSDADDDGRAGWTLVQASELMRRAEELLLDGVTLVGPHAHARMTPGATIALGRSDLARIARALSEGVELAEQLELLAEQLPDRAIAVGWEGVRDAAAGDLARGIVDPARALLAARLLDVAHGWGALAAALAETDAVAAWEGLTVEELLGCFRGADPQLVAQVVTDAGLAPRTAFAACPPEELGALAAGLRRHASRRSAL